MRIGGFELQEPLPELTQPYALTMLRPWVDVGGAGSATLSHLEDCFQAQPLARLARPGNYFDFTRYRPLVYQKEGQREISIPNAFINYARLDTGHDLLFLHLMEPHMLGEAYAESVLRVLERMGVKRYCLLGSMYDAVPHTRPLIVSGSGSGPQVEQELRRLGVQASGYQGPTTICVLISQEAPRRGIEVMSLIVHLPQYAQLDEDYNGALSLLESLRSLYGFALDLDQIRRKAERQYREVSAAVERNPQVKEMVKQLETHYEARTRKAEETGEGPKLSLEIERFLGEIDKRFGQS